MTIKDRLSDDLAAARTAVAHGDQTAAPTAATLSLALSEITAAEYRKAHREELTDTEVLAMPHISQKTVTTEHLEVSTPLTTVVSGELAVPVGHVRDLIHAATTAAEERGIDPDYADAFLLYVTGDALAARIPAAE